MSYKQFEINNIAFSVRKEFRYDNRELVFVLMLDNKKLVGVYNNPREALNAAKYFANTYEVGK